MAGIMARHEERVDKEQDPRGRFHPDRFPFLPSLAATLFRLHHRTCKFTILGGEHEEFAKRCDGPALITSWHFAFPDGGLSIPRLQRRGHGEPQSRRRMGCSCDGEPWIPMLSRLSRQRRKHRPEAAHFSHQGNSRRRLPCRWFAGTAAHCPERHSPPCPLLRSSSAARQYGSPSVLALQELGPYGAGQAFLACRHGHWTAHVDRERHLFRPTRTRKARTRKESEPADRRGRRSPRDNPFSQIMAMLSQCSKIMTRPRHMP